MPAQTLPFGELVVLLDNYIPTEIEQVGPVLALHPNIRQITWQIIYSGNPLAPLITVQASMDGLFWRDLDATSDATGEIKTVTTAAPFLRYLWNSETVDDSAFKLVLRGN